MARIIKLATDSRGTYQKDIGWKRSASGKWVQQRYYLGRSRPQAELRALHLEELWRRVEGRWQRFRKLQDDLDRSNGQPVERPEWDEISLAIGLAVARGDEVVEIDPPDELTRSSDPTLLSSWFDMLVMDYGKCGIKLVLVDDHEPAYREGVDIRERDLAALESQVQHRRRGPGGQRLHEALDAWTAALKIKYQRDNAAGISEHGNHLVKLVGILKEHKADMPLAALDADELDAWVAYWSNRPAGKRGRMAERTCRNVLKTIRAFARWLNRCRQYLWRRPADWDVLPQRIPLTPAEVARKHSGVQVQTYGIEQLALLWSYATPLERCYLSLALNCGFGRDVLARLQVSEIQGEYIKRARFKTLVYAEWLLWPESRAAIDWVLRHRPKTKATELFLDPSGEPIHEPTKGGNTNQLIPNAWDRLYKRIAKDHPGFLKLSFGKVRKTAGNLIRSVADGETAKLFLSHGQPTSDPLLEDYTNRHFGKVFKAIQDVYQRLQPVVFAPVPVPFTDEETRPKYSIGLIRQIQADLMNGMKVVDICKSRKVSRTTVERYREKLRKINK